MEGSIDTLELEAPTPEEPENIEFFMQWEVPLECGQAQGGAEEGDDDDG